MMTAGGRKKKARGRQRDGKGKGRGAGGQGRRRDNDNGEEAGGNQSIASTGTNTTTTTRNDTIDAEGPSSAAISGREEAAALAMHVCTSTPKTSPPALESEGKEEEKQQQQQQQQKPQKLQPKDHSSSNPARRSKEHSSAGSTPLQRRAETGKEDSGASAGKDNGAGVGYEEHLGQPHPLKLSPAAAIVRRLEQEGREARNLATWSLPNDVALSAGGGDSDSEGKSGTRPCSSSKQRRSRSRNSSTRTSRDEDNSSKVKRRESSKPHSTTHSGAAQASPPRRADDTSSHCDDPHSDAGTQGVSAKRRAFSRKSASAGALPHTSADSDDQSIASFNASTASKGGLKARYWRYLFDNLNRAIDELYLTCEMDESALECEEVIMILANAKRDFQALIQRFHMQASFEGAPPGLAPAVAWEIRKVTQPTPVAPLALDGEAGAQAPEDLPRLATPPRRRTEGDSVRFAAADATQSYLEEAVEATHTTTTTTTSAVGDESPSRLNRSLTSLDDSSYLYELESRPPGSGAILHHRLSSPSRKKSARVIERELEERHRRAQLNRSQRQQQLTRRLQQQHDKVTRVRGRREEREEQRKQDIEQRLWKAQQLRQSHLEEVRRRNRDEEIKTREVAFIQRLEEDARRRQVLARIEDEDARLRRRELERRHKMEENARRQAAVQQRRQELDSQRRARLRERDEAWKRRVESLEKERPDRRRMSASRSLSRSTSRTRGGSAIVSPTKPRKSEGDGEAAVAAAAVASQARVHATSHSDGDGDGGGGGGGRGWQSDGKGKRDREEGDGGDGEGEGEEQEAATTETSASVGDKPEKMEAETVGTGTMMKQPKKGNAKSVQQKPSAGNGDGAHVQTDDHQRSKEPGDIKKKRQQQQQQHGRGTKIKGQRKRAPKHKRKGGPHNDQAVRGAQCHGNADVHADERRPVSASYAARAATSDAACAQANAARERRRRPRSSAGLISTHGGGASTPAQQPAEAQVPESVGGGTVAEAVVVGSNSAAAAAGGGGGAAAGGDDDDGWQQPPRRHTCKPRTAVGLDAVSSASVDINSSSSSSSNSNRSGGGGGDGDGGSGGRGSRPQQSPKSAASHRGEGRGGRGGRERKRRGGNKGDSKDDGAGGKGVGNKTGSSSGRGSKAASRKQKRKGRKAAKKREEEAMLDALVATIAKHGSGTTAESNDSRGKRAGAGGRRDHITDPQAAAQTPPSDPATQKRRAHLDERIAPVKRRTPFESSTLSDGVVKRCTNEALLALLHDVARAIADSDRSPQAAASCARKTAHTLLHQLDSLLPTADPPSSSSSAESQPQLQHRGSHGAAVPASDVAVLLCVGAGVLLLHQQHRAHVPVAAVAAVASVCSDRWTAWAEDLTAHAAAEGSASDNLGRGGGGGGSETMDFIKSNDDSLSALFETMDSADAGLLATDGLMPLSEVNSGSGTRDAMRDAKTGAKNKTEDEERKQAQDSAQEEKREKQAKAALVECARAVVRTGAAVAWVEALSLSLRESQVPTDQAGSDATGMRAGTDSSTPKRQKQSHKQARKQTQPPRGRRGKARKNASQKQAEQQQQQQQQCGNGARQTAHKSMDETGGEETGNPVTAIVSSSSSLLSSLVEVLATAHDSDEQSAGAHVQLLCDLQELILGADIMHTCRSWADALSHPIQVDVFSTLCSLSALVSSLVRHDATRDGWALRLYIDSSCAGQLPLLSVCTPPQRPPRQTQPAHVQRSQQQQQKQQREPRQALFMLLANHVLRALTSLAAIDGSAFVTATSEREAWPSLVHTLAHVFREAHRTSRHDAAVIAALHCVAWLCRLQPEHKQRMLGLGATATLPLICSLPIRFFTAANTQATDALFAAIVSVCLDHEAAVRALQQDLSPLLVVEHLQHKLEQKQQLKAHGEQSGSAPGLNPIEMNTQELQHAIGYFQRCS